MSTASTGKRLLGWEYEMHCNCGESVTVVVPTPSQPTPADFDAADDALDRLTLFASRHAPHSGLMVGGLGEQWGDT